MSLPVPIRMTPSRAGWPTAVVVAALSLTATGCTRKVIAAAPAPVPLAVPSVPPRIVGPGRGSRRAAAAGGRGAGRPDAATGVAAAGRHRPPDPAAETAVEDPQRARAEGAEPAAAAAPTAGAAAAHARDGQRRRGRQEGPGSAAPGRAEPRQGQLSRPERQRPARMPTPPAGSSPRPATPSRSGQLVFALSMADKAEALSTSLVNR